MRRGDVTMYPAGPGVSSGLSIIFQARRQDIVPYPAGPACVRQHAPVPSGLMAVFQPQTPAYAFFTGGKVVEEDAGGTSSDGLKGEGVAKGGGGVRMFWTSRTSSHSWMMFWAR
jgi:hypothetical protein